MIPVALALAALVLVVAAAVRTTAARDRRRYARQARYAAALLTPDADLGGLLTDLHALPTTTDREYPR